MTIQVQAQINGGAQQTGAVTVAAGDVVQLSLVSAAGVGALLWEIYSHPTDEAGAGYGLSLPSGWTDGADGHSYFYEGTTPPTITIPSAPYWGKVLVRCTPGGNALAADESLVLTMLSPLGLEDVAPLETIQADAYRTWMKAFQNDLRLLGTVTASGRATSLLWDADNATDASIGRYSTFAEVAAQVALSAGPVKVRPKGACLANVAGTYEWGHVTIEGNRNAASSPAATSLAGSEGVILRNVRVDAPIAITTSATTTRLFEYTVGHQGYFRDATLSGNASVGLIRANHTGTLNVYFDGVTLNRNAIELTTTTTVNAYVRGSVFGGASSGHVKGTTGTLNLRTDAETTGTYDGAAFSGTYNATVISNPTKISDVTVSGTASANKALVASSSTDASWVSVRPERPDQLNDLVCFTLSDAAGTTTISNSGSGTAFSLDTPTGAGSITFGAPQPFGDGALIVGVKYITGTGGQTYQPSVTNFTASCWVMFKKSPALGGANFVSLFGKLNTTDSTFALGFDLNLGEFKVKVGAGGVDTTSTGQPLMVGERHHLAMTYDGSNIRLCQNGVLTQTTAKTGTLDWSNAHNWIVGNAGATGAIMIVSECKFANVVKSLDELKAETYQGQGWSS